MANQPEHVVRIGPISVSIFANTRERDGEKTVVRNVKLQRRFKDAEGEWKSNASFTLGELAVAQAVLRLAFDYVASKEARQS